MLFTKRWSLHPLFRDVGLTIGTEVVVFLSGLILIGVLGRTYGSNALSEYLLVRRVCAWLQSGVMLGLGVAIARCTAHAKGLGQDKRTYFLAGSSCLMSLEVVVAIALYLFRPFFSKLMFGSESLNHLVLPLACLLLGLGANAAVYGYYRGCLELKRANALQFCSFALVPLLAVVILSGTGSATLLLGAIGIGTLCIAVVFAVPLIRESLDMAAHGVSSKVGELLRYGVARVPADFGSSALFSLGPIVAAQFMPLTDLSALLLGTSILIAVSLSSAPIGLVLLSKITCMLAEGRAEDVRSRIRLLLLALVDISMLICLQTFVFADVVVRVWVGNYVSHIGVIRTLTLAIPFYLLYTGSRSVIDAATPRPHNAYNVVAALAVFCTCTAVACLLPRELLIEGIAVALLAALFVLAILTVHTLRLLYDVRLSWTSCVNGIVLGVALGCLSLVARHVAGEAGPIFAIFTQLLVCSLFLVALFHLQSPWLRFMAAKGLTRLVEPRLETTNVV